MICRSFPPILLGALLFGSASVAQTPLADAPPDYRKGFESISEASLRATLRFLASAELEGRESGTRGYDVAALFVACLLEGLGVAPAGDGDSFYQELELVRRTWNLEEAALSLRAGDAEARTLALKGQVALRATRDIDWRSPWVFVGHGEGASQDAPDDFYGQAIEGHVVLVLPRDPKRPDLREARRRGVRRLVVISDFMVERKAGLHARDVPRYLLEKRNRDSEEPQVVYISEKTADEVLESAGTSVEELRGEKTRPRSRSLSDLAISLRIPREEATRKTRNVLGRLEGTDPRLKSEYVVLGAHLDHIGIQGGKVHPGADDDASGVSAVLGVARAFMANGRRPRRSVLFAFFAAEEKGLFGSRYFVDHPPVPLDRIVLQIQLDMVGREPGKGLGGPPGKEAEGKADRLMYKIGTRRHSAELDSWVADVNRYTGLAIEHGNERFYGASDQYWFGQNGIPVAFFFSGIHEDYHKPTDTVEKIRFSKILAISRLAYALAFEVADRERRLTINRF